MTESAQRWTSARDSYSQTKQNDERKPIKLNPRSMDGSLDPQPSPRARASAAAWGVVRNAT